MEKLKVTLTMEMLTGNPFVATDCIGARAFKAAIEKAELSEEDFDGGIGKKFTWGIDTGGIGFIRYRSLRYGRPVDMMELDESDIGTVIIFKRII